MTTTGVLPRTTRATRGTRTSAMATRTTTIRTTTTELGVSGVLNKAKSQSAQVFFNRACATLLE